MQQAVQYYLRHDPAPGERQLHHSTGRRLPFCQPRYWWPLEHGRGEWEWLVNAQGNGSSASMYPLAHLWMWN